MAKRDTRPLAGVLFVVLVLVAFIPLGGDTPDGDASGREVVSFYTDNDTREIIASVVLALSAVALLFFAATVRDRFRDAASAGSALPSFALGAGVVAAGGFLAGAGLHFALADYADDVQPAAAQAMNAIDNDFFLPFSTGIAAMVLAMSLLAIRTRLLPPWLGWIGVVLFIVFFTPVGFVAFGLSAIWIIAASVMLYLRGETSPVARPAGGDPPRAGGTGPAT
jgi:hypothetical protein